METSRGRFCSQPISSRAFYWFLVDYLIRAPTQWAPQRAVNVPSQRQRAKPRSSWPANDRLKPCMLPTLCRTKFDLGSLAFLRVQLPWENPPHSSLNVGAARPDALSSKQKEFVHLPNNDPSQALLDTPLNSSCTRARLHSTMMTAEEA